jgi:CRISPR-associated protein Cmr5
VVLGYRNAGDLLEASRTAPLSAYMRLTQEALQALLWFKRYAQSVLNVEGGSDEQPTQ